MQTHVTLPLAAMIACAITSTVLAQSPRYRVERKLTIPTGESGARFGESIAVAGDVIAVGANNVADGFREGSGAVFLFDRDGSHTVTIRNPIPQFDAWFGEYITNVGDDKLLVAARQDNDSIGIAYLFDLEGNLLHTFDNPDPDVDDEFGGRVVTTNGELILIAAYQDLRADDKGRGTVYLYDLEGNLQQTIRNPLPEEDGFFGRAATFVGADKDRILISDHGATVNGLRGAGIAFLFDLNGNLLTTVDNPDPEPLDVFGTAVGYSANRIRACKKSCVS